MTAVEQGLPAGEMMRRLGADDYAVDAVTAAKALVVAWLCRRLEDGSVVRRRITETEGYCGEKDTSAPRIGISYASKRDQNRKWRFTLRPEGRSLARRVF